MRSEQSHYEELAACQAKLDAILQQRHISWLGWLESLDSDARAVMSPGAVYEVVRQAWFTRNAEVERLRELLARAESQLNRVHSQWGDGSAWTTADEIRAALAK